MVPEGFEGIIILLLFVVRIGIPMALTLALGHWLERKLRPQDAVEETERVAGTRSASNVIRLHCWDIKRCSAAKRAQCAACRYPDLPCWLALQVDGGKVSAQCFACRFYKPEIAAA